jgi:hypothetical protein
LIDCREVPGGVEFQVRVSPGARREGVQGLYGTRLKLAVAAPPDKGKANRAVEGLVARLLGVRRQDVTVVKGGTSRDKVLRVLGVTVEAVERLAPAASK